MSPAKGGPKAEAEGGSVNAEVVGGNVKAEAEGGDSAVQAATAVDTEAAATEPASPKSEPACGDAAAAKSPARVTRAGTKSATQPAAKKMARSKRGAAAAPPAAEGAAAEHEDGEMQVGEAVQEAAAAMPDAAVLSQAAELAIQASPAVQTLPAVQASPAAKAQPTPPPPAPRDTTLLAAFLLFDTSGCGHVRTDDLRHLLHGLGRGLSHRVVRELALDAAESSSGGRGRDCVFYRVLAGDGLP